jgi:hypothetical protein
MRAISMSLLLCTSAFGCSGKTVSSSLSGSSGMTAKMSETSTNSGPSEGGASSVASSGQSQDNNCEVCDGGCSNGLVTECLVLDPPGCGAQSALGFCPGGCTRQGCNYYPVDGSTSGCVASSVTIQQGAFAASSGAVAITRFPSDGPAVVVATSKTIACAASGSDGGAVYGGDGAFLVIQVAPNEAGTEEIRADHIVSQTMVVKNEGGTGTVIAGEAVARLTVWKNGALVQDGYATSGTVSVNVYDPIGGVMGSYDLAFDSGDVEQATFIAPACDPCTDPFSGAQP